MLWDRAAADADNAQARLDKGERTPLLGVPIAIKDDTDVEGAATLWGTNIPQRPARADAEAVRRLREAGAVIIGKTNMPELALWTMTETAAWGVTRNPWNLQHTCGGSSGGSAAAVAAGLASAALGTDGGGSIRIPAAWCGAVALKGQRGRISLMPAAQRYYGLEAVGPITRSVRDNALLYDVLAGAVEGDTDRAPPTDGFVDRLASPRSGLRIAVSFAQPMPLTVADVVRQPVLDAVKILRGLGHDVEEANPRYGMGALTSMPRFLRGTYEEACHLGSLDDLEPRTRAAVASGRLIPLGLAQWSRRQAERDAARNDAFFGRFDALLTPVTAQPAPKVGAWSGRGGARCLMAMLPYASYTAAWNATGQPAAVVPTGIGPGGLPMSVQIVARTNDEHTVLGLASQIEAARGPLPRPSIADKRSDGGKT